MEGLVDALAVPYDRPCLAESFQPRVRLSQRAFALWWKQHIRSAKDSSPSSRGNHGRQPPPPAVGDPGIFDRANQATVKG